MFCNATIFDTQYTVINGAITSFEMSPSNELVTTLMIQPSSSTITGSIKLEDAANLAALSTTPQQFADIFSLAYSRVLLSLVAGVMVPSPTLELQQHSEIIVFRVSKAPLYTLVVLSFLFVGFGAVLTLVALAATYNTDLEEVRERLSARQGRREI
jgi:hypothetical protein